MKYFILCFIVFCQTACFKKGDSDPWISIRKRETRLKGKWDVIQYYYYDGNKSGVNNLGDPVKYQLEIGGNGKWSSFDTNWVLVAEQGNWYWASKSASIKKQEVLVLGTQHYSSPTAVFHILERLTINYIRSRFQFDGDPKRYYIYEWKRHK